MMAQNNNNFDSIDARYLYADFSDFPEITDDIREKNSKRIFTGGVRINNSMYRTKHETEQYIKKSLKRKLP